MNCENVAILLDEFVDGELADADRRLVEAHLAGCELCAEACEALEREQTMYARYERPVETGDAMWAAIRSRIEPDAGNGLTATSAAGALQIRGVDTGRFVGRLGRVPDAVLEDIGAAVLAVIEFDLAPLPSSYSSDKP